MAERKSSNYFLNSASPPAQAGLLNSRQISILPGIRSAATANVGLADAELIRKMLSHTRGETPVPLNALPAGVTDARLFRVWVSNGLNNVVLNRVPANGRTVEAAVYEAVKKSTTARTVKCRMSVVRCPMHL